MGELPKKFEYLCDGMENLQFNEDFICSVDIADESLLGVEKEKYEGNIDFVSTITARIPVMPPNPL